MNWINVKERLPETPCKLVCLINGQMFIGEAVYHHGQLITIRNTNYIFYRIDLPIADFCTGELEHGGYWEIPNHFREVTHWIPLPEVPNELD